MIQLRESLSEYRMSVLFHLFPLPTQINVLRLLMVHWCHLLAKVVTYCLMLSWLHATRSITVNGACSIQTSSTKSWDCIYHCRKANNYTHLAICTAFRLSFTIHYKCPAYIWGHHYVYVRMFSDESTHQPHVDRPACRCWGTRLTRLWRTKNENRKSYEDGYLQSGHYVFNIR